MLNKKGQTDIIGNILKTLPKPVIFLVFIMIVIFIVALLSPVFGAFGVFCDSSQVVINVENSNIVSNINLLNKLPSANEINKGYLEPDSFGANCITYYNNSFAFVISDCHRCDGVIFTDLDIFFADLCYGDAYNWDDPTENVSWYMRTFVCPVQVCDIPSGYYYNSSIGKYLCQEDCNLQIISQERDEKLAEAGGKPLYIDTVSNSYDGFMRFECTKDLKVEPTIKGVPIFRLDFWAISIAIILMLWGIMRFAKK